MGKRSKSNARMWAARVGAFEASGQNRRAWCEAQGIRIHTLDYWRLKLRREAESKHETARIEPAGHHSPSTAIAVVPVRVRSGSTPTPRASSTAIELEWPNGVRLRTALGANVHELSALVRALWPC
jgi:hypothetical protein